MAIQEIKITKAEAKHEKKRLEEKGWRSAQYWIRRRPVTAEFLREFARAGMINATNLNTDGAITWYYTKDAVDIACLAYASNVSTQ
jgi:hypothetical protein